MEKFFLLLLLISLGLGVLIVVFLLGFSLKSLLVGKKSKKKEKIIVKQVKKSEDTADHVDVDASEVVNDIDYSEPEVVIKNTAHYTKKSTAVLFFSNIGEPKVVICKYKSGVLEHSYKLDLTGFNLENGLIANIDALAEVIKKLLPRIGSLDVVLNVSEVFKSIESLPKMPFYKARKLYEKELKNDFPNYKDKYLTFENYFNHSLGVVFTTYFISNTTIKYFKKLANILGAKLNNIELWGDFLFNNVKKRVSADFVLIYVKDDVGTILNSTNGNLVTYSSFKCESEEDITTEFLSKISRHEFELAKAKIKNYIYITDYDYDISDITINLNRIDCNIDFSHYNLNGK